MQGHLNLRKVGAVGHLDSGIEHEAFEEDVFGVFDWVASVDARAAQGGTALGSIDAQLQEAGSQISAART